jgi:hypothetical protein
MVSKVGYSVVKRSGARVTLCAVYTMHEETRSVDFLVEPQNHWDDLSVVWHQNHWNCLAVVVTSLPLKRMVSHN